MSDTVSIILKWTKTSVDPFNYKPFSPEFEPQEVYVEVDVPKELVRNDKVLTPEGMGYVLNQLAMGIRDQNKNKDLAENEMEELLEGLDSNWDE